MVSIKTPFFNDKTHSLARGARVEKRIGYVRLRLPRGRWVRNGEEAVETG